jgi:hypothetical protein
MYNVLNRNNDARYINVGGAASTTVGGVTYNGFAPAPDQVSVTLLLHWCHTVATVVLQRCYTFVTLLLQWCCGGVAVVLHYYYTVVTLL